MEKPSKIAPAKGKLGILLPGMGAVSTTFMARVELVRKGKSQPVGSLTQMGTIRLGKRTDARSPLIKKFVPLAELSDLTFGGWDIFKDNAYQSAANAGLLNPQDLEKVKPFLSTIKPMKAAFDHDFVKMIDGPNIKKGKNKYEMALQIKEDIASFRKASRASRLVTCWCASTGSFKTKEESKLSVLEYILQPQLYPQLYGKMCHKVRINYYPPRGDNKEGWDNIDIFGWLGYPMQIKVDFLCRDSILAAPIVLDLVLFLDLAQRA